TASDDFGKLDTGRQITTLDSYNDAITQSQRGGKPLTDDQNVQLKHLLTSSGYASVDDKVKTRVLGMFGEYANSSPDKVDNLLKLVNDPGFDKINNEGDEMQFLEGYQHDGIFSSHVDQVVANTTL